MLDHPQTQTRCGGGVTRVSQTDLVEFAAGKTGAVLLLATASECLREGELEHVRRLAELVLRGELPKSYWVVGLYADYLLLYHLDE